MQPLPSSGQGERESQEIASVESVIQLVRNWIESAQLRQGDRLPTERALAEQFNLNRNLVRRAFLQLDKMGLINRHVGRGTFVGGSPPRGAAPAAPLPQREDYSPAAVLQARTMFEPRIASLAVANATSADFRALEELLVDLAAAETYERVDHLSIAFGEALAAAGHNPLITSIAAEIAAARRATLSRRADRITIPPEERQIAIDELTRVLEAMRSRDPAAAAAAVRTTLIRASRSFSLMARMELLPEDE